VNVEFKRSFEKDLRKIRSSEILLRIKAAIAEIEVAEDLSEVSELKKMQGYRIYYRIRVGDYRLGLIIEDEQVVFVRALHRREIYRYFP
jgi:mRNA interferase RelE/StbE